MARPKHKRCHHCGVVVSRYSHTRRQGPIYVAVWERDERNGCVQGADGNPYCQAHADIAANAPAPADMSIVDLALSRAANDPDLPDSAFIVLSRALRGDDPRGEEVRP